MTIGRGIVIDSEWSTRSERSRISARDLRISTVARRTLQTLIGSYVAFRTSTRPPVPEPTTGGEAGGTGPFTALKMLPGHGAGSRRIRTEDLHHPHAARERGERLLDVR